MNERYSLFPLITLVEQPKQVQQFSVPEIPPHIARVQQALKTQSLSRKPVEIPPHIDRV